MKILLFLLIPFVLNAQIVMSHYNFAASGGGGGGAYVTDSLKHYYVLDSLDNGSVDEWFDAVRNYRVTYVGDSSFRPIKSGNELLFDGNDFLRGTASGGGTIFDFSTTPITAEVLVDLADTTVSQDIFTVMNTRTISIGTASNRICVRVYDGTNAYVINDWSTPYFGLHHILIAWDGVGTNAPDIYLDGSLRSTDLGNTEHPFGEDNRIYIGGSSSSGEVAAGTSIPLARVYNLKFNSTQASTNYNSDSVQDLIP